MEKRRIDPMDPELIDILNQLYITKELYSNAVNKVSDWITHERIKHLIAKKKVFIKEISHVFGINMEIYFKKNEESINLQCQKVMHQFEDLFLQGNDEKLIAFIISTEKKLQKLYQALTATRKYDDFTLMIMENQLSESRRDMIELNELQNEYI